MPFSISGNLDKIDRSSLRKLEKKVGIILSPLQPPLQQKRLIQTGLKSLGGIHKILESLSRRELLSFIFLITQFGDITLEETPQEYSDLSRIPYVLEWKPGHFMIPLEILEVFSQERLFKEQNYLFALIPNLPKDEKKAWIRWIGADYEPNPEKSIDFELYTQCRILQKPFQGKSLVQDSEFRITDIWPVGNCEEIDWYYKNLTSFYYSLQELSKKEKDPFRQHILEIVKSGKFILRKQDRYQPNTYSFLVSTVEGSTPQLRDYLYQWEKSGGTGLFQI